MVFVWRTKFAEGIDNHLNVSSLRDSFYYLQVSGERGSVARRGRSMEPDWSLGIAPEFAKEDSPKGGKRRGPQSGLTDPQLHNRRDRLIQAFEADWGEIGWDLQVCKKPDDLIRIFSPLAEGQIRDLLLVFCRPAAEAGSSVILRNLRSEINRSWRRKYRAEKSFDVAIDRLRETNRAFDGAARNELRIVKHERKK